MNKAQYMREKINMLKSDYNVSLSEIFKEDIYFTNGSATNCDFKLLFSKNDVVVAIFYIYPDGRFFGTDNKKAFNDVDVWVKNLNKY
jgi:hypothetical protein